MTNKILAAGISAVFIGIMAYLAMKYSNSNMLYVPIAIGAIVFIIGYIGMTGKFNKIFK